MSWSVKLFRIKGIDVKVHVTFVLILIWAAIVWGAGGAGIGDALMGVVAMLLLFACITLHELAHSFEALRYGLRVRDIILLPIGGVSQIEQPLGKPGQELRIALVGPLTSFALAVVFYVVAALVITGNLTSFAGLPESPTSEGWLGLVSYLAIANLLLGLFNLIPAFPMDGGRVLRALLAMRMDYRKATAIAVAVGQGLAMGVGLLGFIVGNFLLVLIAIFVWIGAGQEGQLVQARGALGDVKVAQAMTRRPRTLSSDDLLERAVDLTLTTSQADFPVVDDQTGTVVGFLGRDNLLKGLRAYGAAGAVHTIMQRTFAVAAPDESLYEIQQRMVAEGVQALPVIENGHLVGLLTALDVSEAYLLLTARHERAEIAV
jgi:Zn-dependent protease/predicted transcriptional regulator